MNTKLFLKPNNQLLVVSVIIATALTSGITYYGISQSGVFTTKSESIAEAAPTPIKITALGRLEPEGEVIKLSAPLALDGDRVAELMVKEGDQVKPGQVIAVMDSRARLQDALLQAQKQAELDAQKATDTQQYQQPYQQIGFLSDVYSGVPTSQATTTMSTGTPASAFQQAAGMGIAALGAAGGAKNLGIM